MAERAGERERERERAGEREREREREEITSSRKTLTGKSFEFFLDFVTF